MNGANEVHKIVPIRDLKLRKWACVGFILASFVGLISFLWVPDIFLNISLLYTLYIVITFYVLRFTRVDIFSPLMIFIFFSWLGFGLKLPLLSVFPNYAFFIKGYHYNFLYNNSTIVLAFGIFLVGYISFIIGFHTIKRGVKFKVSERPAHPFGLVILSAFLIVFSFYVRNQYHIGMAGLRPSIDYAGYIYYLMVYGTAIVVSLVFYSALVRNSIFYTIVGFILFGAVASLEFLLGWKGGAVHQIFPILMIYYYVTRYRLRDINTNIRRSMVVMVLLLVLSTLVLYPIIEQYRYSVINFGQTNIKFLSKPIDLNVFKSLNSMISRVSGLDNLTAAVAYFYQDLTECLTNQFFFLHLKNLGISVGRFYTSYVLGVNPEIVTANAATIWGILYILGGVIAVFIGLFFAGMFSKMVYLTLLVNIRTDGRWIVFYAVLITNVFQPLVFEGGVSGPLKGLLAAVVIYGTFIFILDIAHLRPHAKEVNVS